MTTGEGRRAPACEETVRRLRQMLLNNRLRPDGRLPPERQLARDLGVSRATVRRAMRALESAGLVARYVGRGTFALKTGYAVLEDGPDEWFADSDVLTVETMEVRLIIEPATARLAAERATNSEIQALRDSIERQEELIRHGQSIRDEDHHFHVLLSHAARNRALGQVVRAFNRMMLRTRRMWTEVYVNETSLKGHRRILRAVERRDGQAAHDAMLRHLEEVQRMLLSAPMEMTLSGEI